MGQLDIIKGIMNTEKYRGILWNNANSETQVEYKLNPNPIYSCMSTR